MPTDFSTPIYAQEESPAEESTHALSDVSEVEGIDLNDPALLQEEITGANPDADPYATPPPPPDAWYRVKLKRLDVKQKDKQGNVVLQAYSTKPEVVKGVPVLLPNGKPKINAWMALEATIIDINPTGHVSYDGIRARDYFISTKIDKRSATSTMLNLVVNVFKITLPPKYDAAFLVNSVVKALAGEPEVDAEIIWSGSPNQADTDAIKAKGIYAPEVKGMHKFPQVKGIYQPEMMVEVAGFGKVSVRAQPRINGYAPVGTKTKKR
jgi:hypothetical protein